MKDKRIIWKCPNCGYFLADIEKKLAKQNICPRCLKINFYQFIEVELKR